MNCAMARSSRASVPLQEHEARAGDLGGRRRSPSRRSPRPAPRDPWAGRRSCAGCRRGGSRRCRSRRCRPARRRTAGWAAPPGGASAPRRGAAASASPFFRVASRAATSAISASAGSPLPLAMPIWRLSALRWACAASLSEMAARRRLSISSSSADSGARLRFFRPASNAAGFSRMKRMSCMVSYWPDRPCSLLPRPSCPPPRASSRSSGRSGC